MNSKLLSRLATNLDPVLQREHQRASRVGMRVSAWVLKVKPARCDLSVHVKFVLWSFCECYFESCFDLRRVRAVRVLCKFQMLLFWRCLTMIVMLRRQVLMVCRFFHQKRILSLAKVQLLRW
jgi:hypothetical protein